MERAQMWLEEEGLALLEGWVRDGLTKEQIAERVKKGSISPEDYAYITGEEYQADLQEERGDA